MYHTIFDNRNVKKHIQYRYILVQYIIKNYHSSRIFAMYFVYQTTYIPYTYNTFYFYHFFRNLFKLKHYSFYYKNTSYTQFCK